MNSERSLVSGSLSQSGGTPEPVRFDLGPVPALREPDRCCRGRRNRLPRFARILIAREQREALDQRGTPAVVASALAVRGHTGIASRLSQVRRYREVADCKLRPNHPSLHNWGRSWSDVRGVANQAVEEKSAQAGLALERELDARAMPGRRDATAAGKVSGLVSWC